MPACPIWGTEAQVFPPTNDVSRVISAWAGGSYRISGSARIAADALSVREKARLTTLLVDQRRSGEANPLVTSALIERAQAHRPLRISERTERFFLWCAWRDLQPSDQLGLESFLGEYPDELGEVSAWTESGDGENAGGFIRLLKEQGYVSGELNSHLTAKGFERLEAAQSATTGTQAFVAMWFDPSLEDAFEQAIAPAIEDAGFRAFRIDRKEHGNKIDDEIIAEIRRSRFVVADFTCGLIGTGAEAIAVARGGVYYEAGFAQGLGVPVIWSCREDCLSHVHFDTRQFNHIVWSDLAALRTKLYNRIRAVIA